MLKKIKPYINRYTISGGLVALLVFWFCSLSHIVALIVSTVVLGGIGLWMKSFVKPAVPCGCCGKPTTFAGYCPCGGRVDQKPMKATVCPEPTCKRPGGVVSEEPVSDPKGTVSTHRHYACSGGHSWDAFGSQS